MITRQLVQRWSSRIVAGRLFTLAPSLAFGQGNISVQGLGYAPGQLSTPAVSMGGGIGEIDPLSPLNPASIALATTPMVYMQAEPEYRTLHLGGQTFRS